MPKNAPLKVIDGNSLYDPIDRAMAGLFAVYLRQGWAVKFGPKVFMLKEVFEQTDVISINRFIQENDYYTCPFELLDRKELDDDLL